MIRYLSKEVQGKLRSGIAIVSLQQCVEELIVNSIDAGATCVGVRVDVEAFKVQVVDNGFGMDIGDMEHVGKRYFTSKCSSLEDMGNLKFYGFRGEALASIATLAMVVEISSRTKMSGKTHVKILKEGKSLDVFEAENTRPSAGTTVIICNLFYNMPVRRKRMDSMLEFERVRQRLEAVSLMHPSVSFSLKNDCTGTMVMQLSKAQNTYYRFVQIYGLGRAQKLAEIGHSHAQFEVSGYIGKKGHYNNTLQFLFVNDRLLLKTRIHKLLNLLLRKVGSSTRLIDSPGTPAVRSPQRTRGAELHAMYVINIKCHYSEYDICFEPAKTLIEFKVWESLLACIEETVKAFLNRENLRYELSPEDIQDVVSQNVFSVQTASTDRGKDSIGKCVLSHLEDGALECNIGRTLASEAIHRRPTMKESVCQSYEGVESEGGRIDKQAEGEVLQECEQELVHNTRNTQSGSSSSNTLGEAEYNSNTNSPVTNCSANDSNKDIIKEDKPDAFMISEHFRAESSHQHSLIYKTKIEHQKIRIDQGTEINNKARTQVSFSKCVVSAPDSVTKGDRFGTGSMKHSPPQLQDKEHSLHEHKNLYIHSSSILQKYIPHKSRQGLALETSEIPTTKRKLTMDKCPGHVNRYLPSKMSKLMSCQKLALCKEPGSLDKFRRIYGKPDNSKTLSVNSSSFVMDATVSQKEQEMDEEKDVTNLDLIKDQKSPLTVSMSLKLNPRHTAQSRSSRKSLAAQLPFLKHQRTEVTSSAFVHPPKATSSEDICLPKTVTSSTLPDINDKEKHNDTSPNLIFIPSCNTKLPLDEQEESNVRASSDWLHHYDAAVGKLVYVNQVTGLSKYAAPPAEETQVPCTSDVTNMAISVISKNGVEYRCYPFPMNLVLPFLPKSKPGRGLSSGLGNGDGLLNPNSLSTLYSAWTNPVFARPPMIGVDISSGQAEGLAVKIHNILFPYRFSKDMIQSMKVIQQVDKKFLACLINTQEQETATCSKTNGNLLVLVDQHAAHERVRLENLIADSYEDNPDAVGERRLCSSTVTPPLEVSLTQDEQRLLRSGQTYWRALGLEMQFSQTEPLALVRKVPVCFTEKESNEFRRGRQSVIKAIVEEYLQEQIESLRSTGRVIGTLPLTVLKVLASIACHGAVKFNDHLSKEECCSLVCCLSSCQLPFQCAHGRPSIAPLVDILHLNDQEETPKPNLRKLRRMRKAWIIYGNTH